MKINKYLIEQARANSPGANVKSVRDIVATVKANLENPSAEWREMLELAQLERENEELRREIMLLQGGENDEEER